MPKEISELEEAREAYLVEKGKKLSETRQCGHCTFLYREGTSCHCSVAQYRSDRPVMSNEVTPDDKACIYFRGLP